MRGTISRAGGTSIASPGSTKARCMSTTMSAVRPAAGASALSKAATRSATRYQGATEKALGM
jgi:16S rRNA C1402 (ribose-2'-O) methylase RsmI